MVEKITMIDLRPAKSEESKKILKFYQNTINSIKGTEFKPKWSNSYPNLEFIETCIEKQELYVCSKEGIIIASIVLNNRFDPEYENIEWTIDAEPQEVIIIHTFAVASDFKGKGIGKEILNLIEENAIKKNQKTIRLDIINGNDGARKFFENYGFEYIATVEIFHEAVGLEKFHLYEYVLEKENYIFKTKKCS